MFLYNFIRIIHSFQQNLYTWGRKDFVTLFARIAEFTEEAECVRNSRKTQNARKRLLHHDFWLSTPIIFIKPFYYGYLCSEIREFRDSIHKENMKFLN